MSTLSIAADFCRTSGSSFHHHKLLLSTGSYPGSVCIRNCCRPAGADWYTERGSAEDRIPTRRTAVTNYPSALKNNLEFKHCTNKAEDCLSISVS